MNGEEQIALTYTVDADDVEVGDTITCIAVIIGLRDRKSPLSHRYP